MNDGLDGSQSGGGNGWDLVCKGLEKGGEDGTGFGGDDVAFELTECTLLAESRDGGACSFTGLGRLFVGKGLWRSELESDGQQ